MRLFRSPPNRSGDKLTLPGAACTPSQSLEAVDLCVANVAWQGQAAKR
jgi:hypothetical protein